MASDNEFMIAEAALQAEFLRRKMTPPETEDSLSELTEGYLADLFADKPDLKAKKNPIRSTFLQRMWEDDMSAKPVIQNIYIGTNGVRDEDAEEEEQEEVREAPAEAAAPVVEAARPSYEEWGKAIAQAVRSYGIVEGADYWPITIHEDHVVASDWHTGKFYRFDYSMEDNSPKLEAPRELAENQVDVAQAEKSAPFQMLRQRDGRFRWLAISSNTYKDSYKENFSKDSLEEAVSAMQKSGDHGELRLEHFPTSRIGTCDFSKVLGNFLVESGTFDSTPRAKKTIETLQEDGEAKWRVSIGFFYNPKYLVDGEYKSHVRINERSITQIPANTLTAISLAELGGSMENADTKARLAAIVGDEFAEEMLSEAKEMPALFAAIGRKAAAEGFTASGVREETKTDEKKDELPPRMIVVDDEGNEMEIVREDLVEEAKAGISRGEIKAIMRELFQEEILPAIKKETDSELPRETRYRITKNGRGARTKEEKEEAQQVMEAVAGNSVAGFWASFPGGRPN